MLPLVCVLTDLSIIYPIRGPLVIIIVGRHNKIILIQTRDTGGGGYYGYNVFLNKMHAGVKFEDFDMNCSTISFVVS